MSLFDDLIGSSSTANSSNKSGQTQVQQQSQVTNGSTSQTGNITTSGTQVSTSGQAQKSSTTGTQSQSGTNNTSGASNTAGASVTSSLDPTTIALIGALLNPLAAQAANPNSGNAGTLQDIAQQFQTKAATPAVSAEDIAGQKSAAVTSFNQNEAVQNARLVQSLGSKDNTYAALTEQAGQKDLASTLAGIVAQAGITNSQLSSQNLANAIQALTASSNVGGQNISNIAALLGVLKGATTSTSSTQTGTTEQVGSSAQIGASSSSTDTLIQAIESILNNQNVSSQTNQTNTSDQETNAAATGTSTSSTAGSQGSGLLGLLF